MRQFFAVLSAVVVIGATVPYFIDVLKHKVKPVRSTRFMFLFLLTLALFQQRSLGTGLSIVVTLADLVSTIILFVISMKKGDGGLSRLDLTCYALLIASVIVWVTTNNAFIALIFTMLTDFIAFFPVVWRTAKIPDSETQIFYWGGVVGPFLGLLAEKNPDPQKLAFVIYLGLANLLVVLLINRQYLQRILNKNL